MLIPFLLLLQYEIWLAPGGIASLWRVRHQLAVEADINQQWQQVLATGNPAPDFEKIPMIFH